MVVPERLIHPNEEKVRLILDTLKDSGLTSDLAISDCQFIAARLTYIVTFKSGPVEVKGFFLRKWLDDYNDSDGRYGEEEIVKELRAVSLSITKQIEQIRSQRA